MEIIETHKHVAFLSTDTTGFNKSAELLRVTLMDADGLILMNQLVHPQNTLSWPEAQQIHDISPNDVDLNGVDIADLKMELRKRLSNFTHIIMYNADFHQRFIPEEILSDKTIVCAMNWSLAYINNHPSYASLGGYLKLPVLASFLEIDECELTRTSLNNCSLTRKVWLKMYGDAAVLENEMDEIFPKAISQHEALKPF